MVQSALERKGNGQVARRCVTPEYFLLFILNMDTQVYAMKYYLGKGREVQVELVNYRKGGERFLNLVTVVPVPDPHTGEQGAFLVGFQVSWGLVCYVLRRLLGSAVTVFGLPLLGFTGVYQSYSTYPAATPPSLGRCRTSTTGDCPLPPAYSLAPRYEPLRIPRGQPTCA